MSALCSVDGDKGECMCRVECDKAECSVYPGVCSVDDKHSARELRSVDGDKAQCIVKCGWTQGDEYVATDRDKANYPVCIFKTALLLKLFNSDLVHIFTTSTFMWIIPATGVV